MKTKFYFGALAAMAFGLGLASCSSDEPAGPDKQDPATDGPRYMTVRITSAGIGSAGRAAEWGSPDEFEPAVGAEGTVTADKVRFYFFTSEGAPYMMSMANVNGTVTLTNMVQPTAISKDENDGSGQTLVGTLVLGTEASGYLGNDPAYVVCVANTTTTENFDRFKDIPMANLKTLSASTPSWTNPIFVMTSSTYAKDGKEVFATDITGKVKKSASEAQNDPAQIYIERLAAKMRVTGMGEYPSLEADGETEAEYTFVNADGNAEKKKVKVDLVGWQAYNMVATSKAIKDITTALTTEPFAGWNDDTKHRSYWAYTPSQTNWFNGTYNIYAADQFTLGNFDAGKPTENIQYCYENTLAPDVNVTDRGTNATAIVVKGIVKDSDGNALNMVSWAGSYYDYDTFRNIVLTAYNANMDETNKATIDQVTLVEGGTPNKYVARVKQTNFSRFDNISWWKDGATSFWVNIEHHAGKIGVVRNHIYEYEFSGVIGLGVPGNEPVNPSEDEETWLAARINVINWHVVKNTIILQ